MKKGLSVFLALALAIIVPLSALAEASDAAVAVNEYEYTVKTIQTYYDSVIASRLDDGETLTAEDRKATLDIIIEGYIDLGVSEVMCAKLGLVPLSSDRQKQLDETVDELYNAYVKSYAEQIAEAYSVTEEQALESAPAFMALSGVTREILYSQQEASYHNVLLMQQVALDIDSSEETISQVIERTYVAPDREKYQNDYAAFENTVVSEGGFSYYMPAGVRLIDRIVLPGNAATAEECKALAETFREALENVAIDVKAGNSLEDVCQSYGLTLEEGYLVHKDSEVWPHEFKDAALALTAPGDVSAVISVEGEPCVLCYRSDIPEGIMPLSDEDMQSLRDYALQQLQIMAYKKQLDIWRADCHVVTHPELIDLGE